MTERGVTSRCIAVTDHIYVGKERPQHTPTSTERYTLAAADGSC